MEELGHGRLDACFSGQLLNSRVVIIGPSRRRARVSSSNESAEKHESRGDVVGRVGGGCAEGIVALSTREGSDVEGGDIDGFWG